MFNLLEYPPAARKTFHKASALWPLAVQQAKEGGVRDLDKLTDLVFFMHHPERMTGGGGRGLSSSERKLIEEWKDFRSMLKGGTSPSRPSSSTKTLAQQFTSFVTKVRRRQGRSLSAVNEAELKAMLVGLSVDKVKMLEWILVLWPRFGQATKMNRMVELVTQVIRNTDKQESKRGRFGETMGGKVKARLSEAAKKTDFGQCLNFLANEGLPIILTGETPRLQAAMKRYGKVSRERKRKGQAHGGGTLSIMASELRLEGLVGPINVLKWKGSASRGHHEPNPVDLFDRHSSAGEGWYFFLASVISFHTFIIAVHVTSGGGKRDYFEIQDGQSVRKSRKKLKAWFDDEFHNSKLANSRVWLIYRRSVLP